MTTVWGKTQESGPYFGSFSTTNLSVVVTILDPRYVDDIPEDELEQETDIDGLSGEYLQWWSITE